jgi:hypothetical protein
VVGDEHPLQLNLAPPGARPLPLLPGSPQRALPHSLDLKPRALPLMGQAPQQLPPLPAALQAHGLASGRPEFGDEEDWNRPLLPPPAPFAPRPGAPAASRIATARHIFDLHLSASPE